MYKFWETAGNDWGHPETKSGKIESVGRLLIPIKANEMKMRFGAIIPFFLLVPCFLLQATAQFVQQGTKLVGTGSIGVAAQGGSVSISANGGTAIVGGPYDDSHYGAAWIYERIGNSWQQTNKIVGTGGIARGGFEVYFGASVAISADGNTVVLGGPGDDSLVGGIWVFVRNGSAWTQQASKLIGSGGNGIMQQGCSVAISADGNTIIEGGFNDDGEKGAAWVFTRSGDIWSQQGGKLVGSGAVGTAGEGNSVALSADGNTAVIGGANDDWFNNYAVGASWVFTRSGNMWNQQGEKLVGSGAIGDASQGSSVSLSSDGNTLAMGGYADNSDSGAVWVFARENGVWTQQGNKLVGGGKRGRHIYLGCKVAMSGNGDKIIAGGWGDNNYMGAAWVYTKLGNSWAQNGGKLVGTGASGTDVGQGTAVAISSNGKTVIVGGSGDSSEAGAAWVYYDSSTTSHTITATTGNHGSINPYGAVGIADKSDVVFSFAANAGYHVDSVIVDGVKVDSSSPYTFQNVSDDHSIRVTFAINAYTITASAGPNGTINPANSATVNFGGMIGFIFTPDPGYAVDSVIIDGTVAPTVTGYTFVNVVSNHTIRVMFQQSVAISANIRGTVFNDINSNGIMDNDEPGVSNWTVLLKGPGRVDSTISDSFGNYFFAVSAAGEYIISESPKPRWQQSFPIDFYSIMLNEPLQDTLGINFGNTYQTPKIRLRLVVKDRTGMNVRTLYFGVRSGASDGIWGVDPAATSIDQSENEFELPPRVDGTFDARFVDPLGTGGVYGFGSWTDIRDFWSSTQNTKFSIVVAANPSNGYPITIKWNKDEVASSYDGSVTLTNNGSTNMKSVDSILVTNPSSGKIDITAQSPLIPIVYFKGWNIASLPVSIISRKQSLFPNAISNAFRFSQNGGYDVVDTLNSGFGFWLKFKSIVTDSLDGPINLGQVIELHSGWNLVGALGVPINVIDLITEPPEILGSSFYEFNAGYRATGVLIPYHGYWVKANSDGRLIMNK